MDLVGFAPKHLDAVLALCEQEGWTTLPADPARAERVLSARGVVTVVALEDREVIGFAYGLTDGAIQAYLCLVAVAREMRRRGIGQQLIAEVLARSGAMRIDLLAVEGSDGFYRSLPHRSWSGYRINPAYGEVPDTTTA